MWSKLEKLSRRLRKGPRNLEAPRKAPLRCSSSEDLTLIYKHQHPLKIVLKQRSGPRPRVSDLLAPLQPHPWPFPSTQAHTHGQPPPPAQASAKCHATVPVSLSAVASPWSTSALRSPRWCVFPKCSLTALSPASIPGSTSHSSWAPSAVVEGCSVW